MNPPSRAPVFATLLMGLYLIPPVHIQAQIVADVPTVASFTELQQELDAAWVNRTTSALYPPGMSYTNSLPLIAVEAGFDPVVLAALQPSATPGGVALRKGIVREDLAGRLWFGAAATAQATTTFPVGYDPAQWVLDTFPPPPGVTGAALDDYIADRRLTRQAMAFSLIAAADVPAYEAELQARFAAAAAAAATLGEEDIGMIHVELTPPSGPMEILVRAPFWVDYLGVYETRDLMNPFPWTPLGTVPHTFDPMAWSYPLPGDLRYVILANHSLDTDLDGIPDAVEQLTTGTDAALADSDGDGLSDYDEIYIYGSNPKSPKTNHGGPGDQVFYGLNATNHPPGNYVSGPVDLRFKTWRATRAKTGYPGFTREGTIFRKYSSQSIYPCYLQTNTVADVVDTEKEEIKRVITRYETPYSEVLYDPESGTLTTNYFPGVTVSSNSVEHVILPWPGVLPWLPQQFSPTNNVSWASPYDACNPSAYADLAEPYTDRLLLAKAGKDYKRARDWTTEPTWGQAMVHERPMPWNGSIQAYGKIDPYPAPAIVEDIWAASGAHRSYVHSGTNTDHTITAVDLQGLVYQATSTNSIPPGFLQRCVVLAVHRAPPAPGLTEGDITRIDPCEVFLNPGGALAHSIEVKVSPPMDEGSIHFATLETDIDVDTDRDGVITTEDDAGEATFTLSRGALIAPQETAVTNIVEAMSPLRIKVACSLPITNITARLALNDLSARMNVRIYRPSGERLLFGEDGTLVLGNLPIDINLLVCSDVWRHNWAGMPYKNISFDLEVVRDGEVLDGDNALLTIAPFILPPECYPAEKVYVGPGVGGDPIFETLMVSSNTTHWMQDAVKLVRTQFVNADDRPLAGLLRHIQQGDLGAVLQEQESIPAITIGSSGDGGGIMATPPLPGAPFGKVLLAAKNTSTINNFDDQGIQPVVVIDTSWLLVGHIDEFIMFVDTNKALCASPMLAVDLLCREIIDGNETRLMWWGTNQSQAGSARERTIGDVIYAKNAAGSYKKSLLSAGGPSLTTNATQFVVDNPIFEAGDLIRLEGEFMGVVAVSGPTVTVTRAECGTAAMTHPPGALVFACGEVVMKNLPFGDKPDESAHRRISKATGRILDELVGIGMSFQYVPVLFETVDEDGNAVPLDDGHEGLTAATPNVANCLALSPSRIIMAKPGCDKFQEQIVSTISNVEFADFWEAHIRNGNIHCLSAILRKPIGSTAWWHKLQTWE